MYDKIWIRCNLVWHGKEFNSQWHTVHSSTPPTSLIQDVHNVYTRKLDTIVLEKMTKIGCFKLYNNQCKHMAKYNQANNKLNYEFVLIGQYSLNNKGV